MEYGCCDFAYITTEIRKNNYPDGYDLDQPELFKNVTIRHKTEWVRVRIEHKDDQVYHGCIGFLEIQLSELKLELDELKSRKQR